MAEKVLMLALSPTMETGTIAKWNVNEGETVSSGDVLCEVETDKAVMDYEAMAEGVLLKIVVPEGGEAKVGELIAVVGEEGEDIRDLIEETPTRPETSVEPPEAKPSSPVAAPETAPAEMPPEPVPLSTGRILSSPLARKMAREARLDLHSLTGTGPGGRIIQRDIEQELANRQNREAQPAPVAATPVFAPEMTDERIRVSQKRKIIAQRLAESKYSAPHYYLKVTARMDEILHARKALNSRLKEPVSFNAFLLKFVAEALKKHPMVNSTWDGDTIIKHGRADIGLAVAQPDGLITPVVRNCGNRGILDIDRDLKDLIRKAQNNRLEPEEYSGATFTISSLGSFGIQEFTAIINPPGSAILAIGQIRKEPVVGENDQILIQANMTMTLSCDHRVIDGAVGAAFLRALQDMLEHPIHALY